MRVSGVEEDQREFAEFYDAAWGDCLRIVMVSVADRPLAEDLVAEAFTRAWASWQKVRGLAEPRAWVIRTAMNARVSWWRRHRLEVRLGCQPAMAAAGQDLALDSALVAVLRRLPVRQREVIALRLLLDLDTATTAEMLGISASTVATHLHRAVGALRRQIPARDDQELTCDH
jgi:RNA polymerase sigma factor (sigma-70 family)